ncbi:exopolysaccharide production repressor protein [Sinorhizobium garamanticum]|uniref:Exopolysaccharide production repressor protein n=1 Tax=Sinorhizobium garamanticum TaxID=680247 RepID=A0ABY8DJP4_9HYPH|nr:exopolysaccharide production repressor protein [Sinorhizobium garamanticum]WEX89740.1 exopolysaccharide production repressor protein [Sinorhizobium garamanticum]
MKSFIQLMAAPAVFVQIPLTSFVTGLITYFSEGSIWPALKYAGGCFVLMQLGYFFGVLYLVYHECRNGREDRSALGTSTTPIAHARLGRAHPRTPAARSF